uniref:Tyrosinase copper-binding domain-containing protein n=1 Tax=Oryza punctata TaxID=4537 RepID=A0A0E0KVG7_ORYPU
MESVIVARGASATPRMAPPCTGSLHTLRRNGYNNLLMHRKTKGRKPPRNVSCSAGRGVVDRRDVLLGIGGAAAMLRAAVARALRLHCDGAYDQVGFPGLEIQIHGGWLFFPWHRMYVYFHERILGKLISDDTFALPFWNYDAPDGMSFPAIYANRRSPLYDPRRNQAHQQPPFPLDLDYSGTDTTLPRDQLIDQNLKIMYRQASN